ncbi:hypothetical protein [Burkholderia sp. Bp9143]|uniref:hypothetical protein n=1 Tax=Burkholderia sp. Bp9143 TaxID=2184574 RepID=UPI000F5AA5EB|nr:hypothetical protein [Burkholderia sp. Bp9143]
MLKFYDAPQGANIQPNAGKNAADSGLEPNYKSSGNDAFAIITAAWTQWFSSQSNIVSNTPLDVRINDIVAAIFDDTNNGLPLNECFVFANLYLLEQNLNKDIALKPFYEKLPKHYKRANNEILATAISIAAAKKQGYKFLGEKSVIDKLYGKSIWTKPWNTSGPDYLLGRANEFCFLEVKSHAGEYARKPVYFEKYKTQSVNAKLTLSNSLPQSNNGNQATALNIRHVLSYGNLPYDVYAGTTAPASVQWFNNADSTQKILPSELWLMQIAIAFCQFFYQLTKTDFPIRLSDIDDLTYLERTAYQMRGTNDFILLTGPRIGREHICAVHRNTIIFSLKALKIFRKFRAGTRVDRPDIYSVFSEIESLENYAVDTLKIGRETYYTEFVSATGVFSLSRNPINPLQIRDSRR